MIREASAVWTAWGMPPMIGEGERPPVPSAPTWYVVDVTADAGAGLLRPDAPPERWYWTSTPTGHSVSFRLRDDAVAYEKLLASPDAVRRTTTQSAERVEDDVAAPPSTGRPWTGEVLRGGREPFDPWRIDEERGAFFTTDPIYAAAFGEHVNRFRISLSNPLVHSEEESQGTIEIDREVLIGMGHDGRAIVYDDGSYDVVAFHAEQIEDLGPSPSTADGDEADAPKTTNHPAMNVEIPSYLTRWTGELPGPPKDWDRNWKVLHRGDGKPYFGSLNVDTPSYWEWDPDSPESDIIGYHAIGWSMDRQG